MLWQPWLVLVIWKVFVPMLTFSVTLRRTFSFELKPPPNHILPLSPPAREVFWLMLPCGILMFITDPIFQEQEMLLGSDFIPSFPLLPPPAIISNWGFSFFPPITPRKVTQCKHEQSLKTNWTMKTPEFEMKSVLFVKMFGQSWS